MRLIVQTSISICFSENEKDSKTLLLLMLVYRDEKSKDTKCNRIPYGSIHILSSWLTTLKELLTKTNVSLNSCLSLLRKIFTNLLSNLEG